MPAARAIIRTGRNGVGCVESSVTGRGKVGCVLSPRYEWGQVLSVDWCGASA